MATTSDDNMRCAQCTYVVLNIFPKMLQDLLADTKETPQSLYRKVMKNNNFRIRLNPSEMNTLQTMATDGYTKLDVSFMYKIIKFFKLIDPPTRNWGANPLAHETELGDDIERIRRARNHLVHKFDANISEKSFIEFFENITIVSRRLDTHLKKQKGMGYENMIQEYKLSVLDAKDKENLLDERKEEECLKQICTCTPVGKEIEIHVCIGKTMDYLIDRVKSMAGDDVTPIKVIIHGIDDSVDKIEMINLLKNELSTDNIIIKSAEKSCIVLFTETKTMALQNYSLFQMEICCLIEKLFQSCNFTCKADKHIYAVVTSAEEEFDHDDLIDSEEGGPSIFGDDDSFVLNVDMKNESFSSSERVEQVISEFFDNIVEKGNGQQSFKKKTIHATLIPESKDLYQFHRSFAAWMMPSSAISDEPKRRLSNIKENVETAKSKNESQGQESISYSQAQIPVQLSLQFSVILRQKILIEQSAGLLLDCVVTDNQLVFTDTFNNSLLIYNKDGSYNRHIQRSFKPWRISMINGNDVAVAYAEPYIDIININTGRVKNTIKTGQTYGMSYQNGMFYVGVGGNKIHVLNTSGEKIRSFNCHSANIEYISTDRNSLFFPGHSTLYCYDLYGTIRWKFTYGPRVCGVAADGNGNVFVTYKDSNKVLFVSTDGKDFKEILTRKDGLESPTGVSFDISNKRLLVCNERDSNAFLYDIKDLTKGH
ncbi:uncharacterized protein LOC143055583 isoform X2 [Mytilus galloprovincialis]|uniref:uncharacterized protein LOC143055583 isoform X2 n=1 Tax=Mytilus galloprovincialis TaxID=29158 RepID=UPI003F7CC53A